METYKKIKESFGLLKGLVLCGTVAALSSNAFAQQELRDAIDAGDVAAAQKMVKRGEVEEIYCGELSPNDAVKIYDKIFKQAPSAGFENCPTQFAYGFGSKVCAMGAESETCLGVLDILFKESLSGKGEALESLNASVKAVAKNKAFLKPVKEEVDTTMWVACPKKGADRAACIEECKTQAESMNDSLHMASCDKKPEHYIETTASVSKPSPIFEKVQKELSDIYWRAPMTMAEKFAKLVQENGKSFSIPDTSFVNLAYVNRWADQHKADSSALPGGQLFRFCFAWQDKVDAMLASKGFDTRCPVFETFVDKRDNHKYKVKDINGVKWFVQNLDYEMEGQSTCYGNSKDKCKLYGRLYTFDAAVAACPEGTHLSTGEEWAALEEFAGGASEAALKLRSNGPDDYAFTALFGGYVDKFGHGVMEGEGSYFWTDSETKKDPIGRSMFSTDRDVSTISVDANNSLSVRCVVD